MATGADRPRAAINRDRMTTGTQPRLVRPGRDDVATPTQVRYFAPEQLVEKLAELKPHDITVALRDRYVPTASATLPRGSIVTDRASLAATVAADRRIAGWTGQADLSRALQDTLAADIVAGAAGRLSDRMPKLSAKHRLTVPQGAFALIALVGLAGSVWADPRLTFSIIAVCCCVLFLAVAAMRAASLFLPIAEEQSPPQLSDDALPVYTVMVALFREIEVVDQLVNALAALDYPPDKLDIKLVLEQEDIATRRYLAAKPLPAHFEVLVVPHNKPQTKPKALNHALAFARGEIVAVYDAEDIPDRDQLRIAAAAFAAAPQSLACLQARLAFYNPHENWFTRQFSIEYAALFDLLLPMLAHNGLPLPLGGTSNHFRVSVLRKVGAWDPHNVTEDADLGLRLARFGWQVGVIDSTTHEEANCRFGNWLHQRARWLKGWMQTWLVHMRSPFRLWRDLGTWRFIVAQIMMLGMIVTALLHPVFLAYAAWAVASGSLLASPPDVLSSVLIGFGIVVLITGYGFAIAAGARGLLERGLSGMWLSLAGMPVYWLLVSAGGWLALWQFVSRPHHWNKTMHGLTRIDPPGMTRSQPRPPAAK